MGLIFKVRAESVVNKGGGYPTKTVMEKVKTITGPHLQRHRHMESVIKVKGSDYVVFVCGRCGARNRRCVYHAKAVTASGAISFNCNRCGSENEVDRPMDPLIIPSTEGRSKCLVMPTTGGMPKGGLTQHR